MIHKAKWRPDFVGSYDGEAEEAGRAEVCTMYDLPQNKTNREKRERIREVAE